MICPHCGCAHLDRGATGLDLCPRCGGLSREGKVLERRSEFRSFQVPVIADTKLCEASGIVVAAGYVDGGPRLLFSFTVGGKALPPISLPLEQAHDMIRLIEDALAAVIKGSN